MLAGGGRLTTLLAGIVESPAFQMRRGARHDRAGSGFRPAGPAARAGRRPWRCRRWRRAGATPRPAAHGLRGGPQRREPEPLAARPASGATSSWAPPSPRWRRCKHHLQIFTGFAQRNANALGDGPGDHARANAAFLTGCHPRKTGGRRHPQRHLRRPGGRPEDRPPHPPALAGAGLHEDPAERLLRLGLQLRLRVQPLLGLGDAARAGRGRSPAGVRAAVRRGPAGRSDSRATSCASASAAACSTSSGRRRASCRPAWAPATIAASSRSTSAACARWSGRSSGPSSTTCPGRA